MRPVPKSSTGVLIVDDNVPFCRIMAHLLRAEPSTHIVGIAGKLDDALHFALQYTPDVLLLDLHMTDLAGRDPISVRLGLFSCVRHIIALSTRTDEEERQFAQLYGASHLVDKSFLSEQLVPSVLSCRHLNRELSPTPRAAPNPQPA